MSHYYWNDWYLGWGWFLWFAVIFLIFSSFGNWRYTYHAHRNFGQLPRNERYARGDIKLDEYNQIKSEMTKA